MTNVDSQRIKEIRDNTRAMAEAFGRIADALAEALELYVSNQTETQNSNLTFEKRTMRDCYNCKRYETEGECIECHFEPKDEPTTEDCSMVRCDRIHEDGVACARYPACDDCSENPLNKVKGSERLVKGSEQTKSTISKMEQVDKDINVRSKNEPQTNKDFKVTYTCSFTDCKNFGFNEKCIECKRKQSEARLEDEPQTECSWK